MKPRYSLKMYQDGKKEKQKKFKVLLRNVVGMKWKKKKKMWWRDWPTVHWCCMTSVQKALTENFLRSTAVHPNRRTCPTPTIPPALWYRGSGSYTTSSGRTSHMYEAPITKKAKLINQPRHHLCDHHQLVMRPFSFWLFFFWQDCMMKIVFLWQRSDR